MIVNRIVYNPLLHYRFRVSRAQGSRLWDDADHELLDFTSGWNVTNLGWNHPEVNEALIRQIERNTYAPMWTADAVQEEYAAALTAAYPGVDTVLRVTGGTEANEVAIKLARAATGRRRIIGFKNSYHGQLFASLALGYVPEYVEAIAPLVPEFVQLDYPQAMGDEAADKATLSSFKRRLTDELEGREVAAMVIEPGIITGWGDGRVAVEGFVELVRELTAKYGTLMIVDEVGSGFSRMGKLFGIQRYEGVKPDIVALAKAIANGAAGLGAVLTRAELVEPTIPKAKYTSTFGWMPPACAAALKTLQIHQRDRVWEQAEMSSQRLQQGLRKELEPLGVRVQGMGLVVRVDLTQCSTEPGALSTAVENECLKQGLAVIQLGADVLQLMPACTVTEADLDEGMGVLSEAIRTSAERI